MEPQVAFLLTHILEGVIDRGTGADARRLDVDLAGKTGTTDNFTDAWFAGFTPRYTIVTWVGHDQKRTIGKGMTGAEAALPIWRQIAEAGLRDGWITEGEAFAVPPSVEMRSIDLASGFAAAPGAPRIFEEAFLPGSAPTETWSPRWVSIFALPWPQQRAFYEARPGEKMPSDYEAALEALAEDGEELAGD